jgi:hypothetical protein
MKRGMSVRTKMPSMALYDWARSPGRPEDRNCDVSDDDEPHELIGEEPEWPNAVGPNDSNEVDRDPPDARPTGRPIRASHGLEVPPRDSDGPSSRALKGPASDLGGLAHFDAAHWEGKCNVFRKS